jgi:hypothetical protein
VTGAEDPLSVYEEALARAEGQLDAALRDRRRRGRTAVALTAVQAGLVVFLGDPPVRWFDVCLAAALIGTSAAMWQTFRRLSRTVDEFERRVEYGRRGLAVMRGWGADLDALDSPPGD